MVVHTNPLSLLITRIQSKLGQKFRFAEPPMIISLVSHQCRFPGDWPKSLDQMNLTAEVIHSHPWLVSSPTRPEGLVIDHRRNHSRSNSANKLHSWVRSVRNIWSKTLDHFCGRVVSKPNLPWECEYLTTFLVCRAKHLRMSHNDVKAGSMNRKAGFPGRSWFSMKDDWWTTKPSLFPIHYVQTTTHTYVGLVSYRWPQSPSTLLQHCAGHLKTYPNGFLILLSDTHLSGVPKFITHCYINAPELKFANPVQSLLNFCLSEWHLWCWLPLEASAHKPCVGSHRASIGVQPNSSCKIKLYQ